MRNTLDSAAQDIVKARRLLIDHHYLASVDPVFRAAMVDACIWWRLAPGDPVTTAGDPCDGCYGIAAGAVSLTSALSAPDSPVAHVVNPGEWYGVDAIFAHSPRTTSGLARGATLIAHLSLAAIDRLADAYPDTWRNLGIVAVANLHIAMNIAVDQMIHDSRRRCLAALLRLAGCRFADHADTQPIARVNQHELAEIANLSRNVVNKVLRRAEDDGQVVIRYGAIELVDTAALRRIVDT